uniref:Uncharacterized protein n=1 Tax=Oryza sativa subsp. japonica TaxID=39947 RepID=Q9FWC9_ORYSJ|nr:hypothetical protein [Oryza sativa Japonica Group]
MAIIMSVRNGRRRAIGSEGGHLLLGSEDTGDGKKILWGGAPILSAGALRICIVFSALITSLAFLVPWSRNPAIRPPVPAIAARVVRRPSTVAVAIAVAVVVNADESPRRHIRRCCLLPIRRR